MAANASNGPSTSAEETWHPARLIPVAGIKGQDEQERRATSVLLAVMAAVPKFGHALLSTLGAPKGRISTFAEIQLKDGDGKTHIPDGAIVVERGGKQWRALVEVKTGRAELQDEQVTRYLEIARDHGFDSLVTISNQITSGVEDLPLTVDRRKTRKVRMFHLSWWAIVTEAVLQHRFRGIEDPDQAWILGELIAYLDHENAGAGGFQDMGERWVKVRDAARQGALRAADPEVKVIAQRWEHFLDYLALGLAQDLGRDVTPARSRKDSAVVRIEALVHQLTSKGELRGGLRVPDTIAPLDLRADLRSRQVTTGVRVDAPSEGRATAQLNWMLRQLREAAPDLRLQVAFANTRDTTSVSLGEAREFPQRALHPGDPKRKIRTFVIAMTRPMGLKRGKGAGSFVRETRRHVLDFYGEVVQDLKAWQARPPQLPGARGDVPRTQQSDPPPFSAVDERDIGEGISPRDEPEAAELADAPTPESGRRMAAPPLAAEQHQ
jgi:hypothetical protein